MAAPCSRFCGLEPPRSSWPAGDRARPERTLVCAVLSQGWLCTQLVQSWGAGLGPRARPVLGRGSGQHQACRSLPSSHRPPSQLPREKGFLATPQAALAWGGRWGPEVAGGAGQAAERRPGPELLPTGVAAVAAEGPGGRSWEGGRQPAGGVPGLLSGPRCSRGRHLRQAGHIWKCLI